MVKPLTMILIIMLAFHLASPDFTPYACLILAGLMSGLVGDIFLMLPERMFIPGLIAFLMGHVVYSAAFMAGVPFSPAWWTAFPLILWGLLSARMLWPSLGKMKIPVMVYLVAILMMTYCAWQRWLFLGHHGALAAALGALCFSISDTVLAWNKFGGGFPRAHAVALGFYYPAQYLMALSLMRTIHS